MVETPLAFRLERRTIFVGKQDYLYSELLDFGLSGDFLLLEFFGGARFKIRCEDPHAAMLTISDGVCRARVGEAHPMTNDDASSALYSSAPSAPRRHPAGPAVQSISRGNQKRYTKGEPSSKPSRSQSLVFSGKVCLSAFQTTNWRPQSRKLNEQPKGGNHGACVEVGIFSGKMGFERKQIQPPKDNTPSEASKAAEKRRKEEEREARRKKIQRERDERYAERRRQAADSDDDDCCLCPII